jgi:hypothetical protein
MTVFLSSRREGMNRFVDYRTKLRRRKAGAAYRPQAVDRRPAAGVVVIAAISVADGTPSCCTSADRSA